MEGAMHKVLLSISLLSLVLLAGSGQERPRAYEFFVKDPVKVCPKRFSLDLENEHVRVIRGKFSPGDDGILCELPGHLMVFLTDGRIRIEFDHRRPMEIEKKRGSTVWVEGGWQKLQNLGSNAFECLLVEPRARQG